MSRSRPDRQFIFNFVASGRGKAQCPPNPNFPIGKSLDVGIRPSCKAIIPSYPAPECGIFFIHCNLCDVRIAVTAAGRPDDPVDIQIPCNLGAITNEIPS